MSNLTAYDRSETRVEKVSLMAPASYRGLDRLKDKRFVNCLPESIPGYGGAKSYFLIKRSGYELNALVAPAGGEGRGVYSWNNKTYTVVGSTLYSTSYDSLGNPTTTTLATLDTSTGYIDYTETGPTVATPYLCITDGVALYLVNSSDVVTTIRSGQVQSVSVTAGSGATAGTWGTTGGGGTGAGGTFTVSGGAITGFAVTNRGSGYTSAPTVVALTGSIGTNVCVANLTGFPADNVGSVVFLDGYVFVARADGSIYNSNLEDPTTWNPSDFITAEMFPDGLKALARQNNMIMALGDVSCEFFFDAANPTGSPLSKVDQAVLQVGAVSCKSVLHQETYVTWVVNGATGGFYINKLEGVTDAKKISSEPIERLLNKEADAGTLEDVRMHAIRIRGHFLALVSLPTANRTLVYDYEEDMWSEWEDVVQNTQFPVSYITQQSDKGVFLHPTNGTLYQFNQEVYQDNGVNFTMSIVTALIDFDTNKRKLINRFELFADKQDSSSILSVEYSDDDYQTWSVPRNIDLNAYRFVLWALGSSRRRAWRLKNTANTDCRLAGIELEVLLGDN